MSNVSAFDVFCHFGERLPENKKKLIKMAEKKKGLIWVLMGTFVSTFGKNKSALERLSDRRERARLKCVSERAPVKAGSPIGAA